MSYFTKFPSTLYSFDLTTSEYSLVTNILVRSTFAEFLKNNTNTYVDYTIKDVDRPDTLAHQIYGRSDYHWVILLFNDIINPYFDWPLSSWQLQNQIAELYPGNCLFLDNDSDYILKNRTTTKLSQILIPENQTIEQGAVSATVVSWEPGICRLHVKDVTGGTFSKDAAITFTRGEDTYSLMPRRVVYEASEALHHFEDTDGNYLDPNGSTLERETNETVNIDLIAKANRAAYLDDNSTSNIRSYMFGENEERAISNFQYEFEKNESKRRIKLLKSIYLNTLVNQFNASLETPIRR